MRERREKLKLFQEKLNRAKKKLKILNNSLESLEKKQKEIINYKISVCNKLNWNNALAGFNFLLFNSVFVAESQFPIKTVNKSSEAFLNNRDSQWTLIYFQYVDISFI